MRDLSTAQIVFQITDGEPDQFLVARFRGTEGLCQLFRFEIDLVTTAEQVTFDDVVGKSAVLSVNASDGPRWFHGIVGRFELTGEANGQMYFTAELVPSLWLLTHRYNCRIFQNQTVPEIITEVLTAGGIASDRVTAGPFSGNHPTREYCVQYRETDYNFIARLMEEEGIRWYFEQAQDGHTLVLADDVADYPTIAGESASLAYAPPSGLNVSGEHVYRFRLGQEVRPGAVALNDFSFEDPTLDLKAKANAGRDTGLEFSDYPGEYTQQAVGKDVASLRMEEFEAARIRGHGQSNSPRLAVGRTFSLTDHPSTTANSSYLLTALVHQGRQSVTRTSGGTNGRGGGLDQGMSKALESAGQSTDAHVRALAAALGQIAARLERGDPTAHEALAQWLYHGGQVSRDPAGIAAALGLRPLDALSVPRLLDGAGLPGLDESADTYECRFECIPASVAYRPPRVTPWPIMRGSQTARVVGPEGQEIHTDSYGRVKVQFNWDREGKFDDGSSCWIRVSQGLAGGAYGMLFLPRVGQEVVIDFLEGDPDRPIIVGRVYNKDHMPAYTLPDEKTKSYIKTHSSQGGGGTNEIRFEDLKDSEQILIHAQKDFHLRVKNNRVESVQNDQHLQVAHKRFEKTGKDSHEEVGQDTFVQVGRDANLTVKGKESIKVEGTSSREVAGDSVEVFKKNCKQEVTSTYACKANQIKLEATSGFEIKCGGSSIVLTPSTIFIVGGPTVNVNSGSGPAVSPVTAGATAPVAPESPASADTVQAGKDKTYSGGEELAVAEAPAEGAGYSFEEEEPEEGDSTWIDLKLVDEEGNPCAGEPYRIIDSKGEVHEGSLDSNGEAHVIVPKGQCDITYPRLDDKSWQRTV